ncbi:hypothetical protein HMI51_20100 [Corallococcus coralloides]|nr:hypothetical protein [Corallococcus coralloides]
MRAFLPAFRALLATALLSGCGTEEEPLPSGPTPEEVCAGVHCTAGYCASEAGAAVCRCGPMDQELGSTCEVDEVDDLDQAYTPVLQEHTLPVVALSGRLHRQDVDLFTFAATQGHTYRFTCTPEGFQWCDLAIHPYDNGQVTYEGRDTVLTVTVETKAVLHSASVAAWPRGRSSERGTYTVSLVDVGDAEGHPDFQSIPIATDGTPFTGHVDFPGDEDAFAFTALAGHVYRLRCTDPELVLALKPLSTPFVTWSDLAWEQEGAMTVVKLGAGAHLLRVGARADRASSGYQCELQDLGPDDHADEPEGATALPAFESALTLTGVPETRSDVDWFSFPAKAGHAYDFVCDSATQSVCAASIVQLSNASPGTPAARPAVLRQDGLLRVRVSASLLASRGPYSLQVVDLGADQGSGVEDAVPASVGVPIPGLFAPQWDWDTFRVDLEAGHVYRLSLDNGTKNTTRFGAYRPSEPNRDLLRIGSAQPAFFKTDRAEPIVFSVSDSLMYGPYVFTIEDVGQDDHADTLEDATVLPASRLHAEGRLDTADDLDWLALDLEARAYEVRTSPVGLAYDLVEADGVTRVPRMDGAVWPRVPGRYYLRLGNTLGLSTPGMTYRWEPHPR